MHVDRATRTRVERPSISLSTAYFSGSSEFFPLRFKLCDTQSSFKRTQVHLVASLDKDFSVVKLDSCQYSMNHLQ